MFEVGDERTSPRLMLDQRVTMRDGVELSADVYLPATGDGPWPAILQRTPYDNSRERGIAQAVYFTQHGYAVVLQDVRGRGDSDGIWEPFVDQARDGHDTVVWVGEQDWCDGKVGMMGVSYGGLVQWMAARERPPYLSALVSTSAAGNWMAELPYRNGIFSPFWIYWLNAVGGRTMQSQPANGLHVPDWPRITRHRPMRDQDRELGRLNTVWRKWLEHSTYDDYWQQLSLRGYFQHINLPVLHITGWFDGNDFNGDQLGQLFYWQGMMEESPARDKQFLLVGPWDHAGTGNPQPTFGEREFGQSAVVDMNALHLRFFDRWLKDADNGFDRERRVRLFIMGTNEWRDEDEWPIARTEKQEFFLHSGGAANTLAGDGLLTRKPPVTDESPDTFVYNPEHPTPATPDLDKFPSPNYPLDNRWRLRRDDVLVYTSEPLDADLEVTGRAEVRLYGSSDCLDTDWHFSLCDVHPDGRSEELSWGCLRAAHRGGLMAQPEPLTPGEVYEFRVEMPATSNVWLSGHRIRFTVASAHFPMAYPNPNTNAAIGDDDSVRIATNQVHHTSQHRSCVRLPVVPAR